MFPIAAVADDEVSEAPEAPIEMQKNLETQSVDNDSNRQTDDVGDSTAVEQPKGSSSVSNETPEVEDTSESGDSAEGESKAGKAEKHPGRGVKSQTVSFEFQHASVTIGSQDGLTLSKSEAFEAAADRELRFDAVADDGFVIKEVTASNLKGAVAPAQNGKTYTISADAVKAGGLTVDIVVVEADIESTDDGESSDEGDENAGSKDTDDEADEVKAFGLKDSPGSSAYVLKVREKVTIKGKEGEKHEWSLLQGEDVVSLSNNESATVTVTGLNPGTAIVEHKFEKIEKNKKKTETETETFKVVVMTAAEPVSKINIVEDSATVFYNPGNGDPSNDKLAVTLHADTDPDDADVTWTSSDTNIATVDKSGKVIATGNSEGPVIITATSGILSDTCTVDVKSMEGQTPVYIYLNANNLEDYKFPGIEPNGNGWYTIGYYMLGEAPTEERSGPLDTTTTSWVANCVRYSGNVGIPTDFLVSIVERYDLKVVTGGAIDYTGGNTETWHLDLYASSASTTYPVTVNYIDEVTGKIIKTATGKYPIGTEVRASWYSNEAIDGYTFHYANPTSITVRNSAEDVLNLYYKKNGTIMVSLDDETVVYDGESHSLGNPTISGGPSGLTVDKLKVEVDGGTGTEAGDYAATITGDETYTTSDGFVYKVVYEGATLHIVKNTKLTEIIADSDSKVYDGQALTDAGFSVVYNGTTIHSDASGTATLPTGDKVTAVVEGSQTDAGESENTVESFTVSGKGFDTENTRMTSGTLSVSKRPVTFTGERGVRTFTGTEIELTGVTVSSGTDQGLVEGHSSNVTASAKGTEAGNYGGEITPVADVRIYSGLNDVTKNYDITVNSGALTIVASAAKWSITLENDTYTYDGQSHANAKTPVSNALSGTTEFSYSFSKDSGYTSDLGSLTKIDAGTYTIFVKATNPNYENSASTEAELVIKPRAVTLKSASLEKKFDGTPLTNANAKDAGVTGGEFVNGNGLLTEDGWVSGEGASYVFSGSQLIQGSTVNSFTYTLKGGTKASNYLISKSEGTLNVVSAQGEYEITVEAKSDSVKYDGQAHSVSGFKTLEFAVKGKTYTVEGLTAEADGTDAGEYKSNVVGTPVVRDALRNDVTENFTVHTVNGVLTIEKRSVIVVGDGWDEEQPYTGKEYSKDTYSFENIVEGQTATISYSLKGIQPGSYTGEFGDDFKVIAKGKDVSSNYELTDKIPGKLSITQPGQVVPEGSDTPSEGKKPVAEKAVGLASKVAKTGDGIMLYALGICGIAVAAGIVALAARRKSGGKQ